MLEVFPQKLIDFIIGISIFAVIGCFYAGFRETIKDRKDRVVSKPENKIVRLFGTIIEGTGFGLSMIGVILVLIAAFLLLIVLPIYVVIHFIVKFW
jgi:hypothetical protein